LKNSIILLLQIQEKKNDKILENFIKTLETTKLFRIELSFNYKFGGNNSKLEKKFQTLKTTNFERIGKLRTCMHGSTITKI